MQLLAAFVLGNTEVAPIRDPEILASLTGLRVATVQKELDRILQSGGVSPASNTPAVSLV